MKSFFNLGLVLIVSIIIGQALACNIIIHVKSDTSKKFQAQITTPNGKIGEKWTFTKPKERNTFQEKADVCGLGDFKIAVFENGKLNNTVSVTLNGIGRVDYLVGDDLKPVMNIRHGASCKGECAPISTH
uniref:Secreted protein n=1 Tax=Parastrongyloides trichosuri TaxID=131310 RepID=A0A0N5A2M7_PARTI